MTFQLISFLLAYPDEETVRSLDKLRAMVWEIPDRCARERFEELVGYLLRTPLLRVQEEYTRSFDLNPATSMELTLHRELDEAERARALSSLAGTYRDEGLETITGELPDHLPLVLEFLAIGSREAGERIRSDYQKPTEILASRLKEDRSPYAGVVGLAAELMKP
jgi:nitrate reductase molybdenum cofactor assembly chaperone NarJ/NarW